jgi:hypothetical protein
MDDPSSKSLRDRLDALLRRAREISAEIERRVDEVTADPSPGREVEPEGHHAASSSSPGPTLTPMAPAGPTAANLEAAQQALEVAAEAVAVTAEAAAVTAEALSTIASENAGGTPPEIPPAPPGAPTTVVPEAAIAVASEAQDAARDESASKEAPGLQTTTPSTATPASNSPEEDKT